MDVSNDDFAQMLMHDITRVCADLIATLATQNGARIGVPNLNDVFLSQIVFALKEKGVPSRVVADMLGISRTSLYRIDQPDVVTRDSTATEVLAVLAVSGPVTKEALMIELSENEPEPILSAVHHLKEIGTIIEIDGKLVCPQENSKTDKGVEELITVLADEWAPISVGALAEKFSAEPDAVRQALERLAADEKVVVNGDTLERVDTSVELIANDARQMLTGLIFTFRKFAAVTTQRIENFPDASGRIMAWTFSDYDEEKLIAELNALSDRFDDHWREKEQQQKPNMFTVVTAWG